MPARPNRLTQLSDTQLRLQLMTTYQQLVNAGAICDALPAEAWERLLLDAEPRERVHATLALLTARQANHEFRPGISDKVVALAIHEATPQQVNEFVFLVDWTPVITEAIAAVTGGARSQMPAELEILGWADPQDAGQQVLVETAPARISEAGDADHRAVLVDGFQCLWAYGVIEEPLPVELLAETFIHLLRAADMKSFNRLVELVPEEALESPLVVRALDQAFAAGATLPARGPVTAPYAAIAPSSRWHKTSAA